MFLRTWPVVVPVKRILRSQKSVKISWNSEIWNTLKSWWLLRFSKTRELWSSKAAFTIIAFFAAAIIIMITSNESWNPKTHKRHRSPPIKNYKPWPLEPFKIKHLFPERSAKMIDSSEKCKRHLAFELQNLCVFEKRSNTTLHFWQLMVKYNLFWSLTVNPIKLSTIARERGLAKVLL